MRCLIQLRSKGLDITIAQIITYNEDEIWRTNFSCICIHAVDTEHREEEAACKDSIGHHP